MNLTDVKLVTIIADRSLKKELIQFFTRIGITGYTYCNVQGKGSSEIGDDSRGETKNIQFKILASQVLSISLMKAVAEEYIPRGNLVIFQQDAAVLRSGKFGPAYPAE